MVQTKSISFWEAFKCCTKAAVATIGVDAQKLFCVFLLSYGVPLFMEQSDLSQVQHAMQCIKSSKQSLLWSI